MLESRGAWRFASKSSTAPLGIADLSGTVPMDELLLTEQVLRIAFGKNDAWLSACTLFIRTFSKSVHGAREAGAEGEIGRSVRDPHGTNFFKNSNAIDDACEELVFIDAILLRIDTVT